MPVYNEAPPPGDSLQQRSRKVVQHSIIVCLLGYHNQYCTLFRFLRWFQGSFKSKDPRCHLTVCSERVRYCKSDSRQNPKITGTLRACFLPGVVSGLPLYPAVFRFNLMSLLGVEQLLHRSFTAPPALVSWSTFPGSSKILITVTLQRDGASRIKRWWCQ